MSKKIKIVEKNTYWQNRAENNYIDGEKSALQVSRNLKNLYKRSYNEIEDKINAFYGKYANEAGLTLEEAKQVLNKQETKAFKDYIEELLKYGNKHDFSLSELAEYRRLYNKAKITRLEKLQANIREELDKLTVKSDSQIEELLQDSYEDNYYKTIYDSQIGIGVDNAFTGLNKKAINAAVNEKYQKSNFSDRLWTNTDKLMQTLTMEIPRGIVLGYNPRKLAREVSKKLDTNYNNTVRLIRTEYGHIMNKSTLDGYKQAGIKQYKILTALDSRRCDDCGDYEGEIFNVDDAIEGINLPPFHPNCRCTTIPYFEHDYIDDMTEEELNNIGYVTYDDWKNELVTLDKKNNRVIYALHTKERKYDKNNEDDMAIINKIANATYNLANNYIGNKGLWNGQVKIVSDNRDPHLYFSDKNYLMEMTSTTSPYIFLHEQLHGHSAVKLNQQIFVENARIEEGTIELLTREISKLENIKIDNNVHPIYDECREALINLNKTLKIADTNLELGQKLIKIDLDKRYDYLENELIKYRNSKGLTQIDDEIQRLQKELDKLYGRLSK